VRTRQTKRFPDIDKDAVSTLDRSAVRIPPPVRLLIDEMMEKIAVSSVDLDHVAASPHGTSSRIRKGPHQPNDVGDRGGSRLRAPRQ
jgi:hypothetical protein